MQIDYDYPDRLEGIIFENLILLIS